MSIPSADPAPHSVKNFLKVIVSGTKEQQELLLPSMLELGCRGFEETATHHIAYFELPGDPGGSERLKTALLSMLRDISANAEVIFEEIADRNWNAEWEQTITPIEIGDRIAIRPSWCEYDGPSHRIVLTIDPKMAFGTGYHETTRLMLRLAEKYVRPDSFVLDVGTGTGILAIAAVKLGAASAVGTDTDEWAVDNANENAMLNDVTDSVTIQQGSIPGNLTHPPSMIFANLTLNDLVNLLPGFRTVLAEGGDLLVSGLLADDETAIGTALQNNGFRIVEILRENEWLAICAK